MKSVSQWHLPFTPSSHALSPPLGEDFGQKIDLTVRIREILRNYPEGTSILKELVQNADDAGAREVRLCLDLRQHGTTGLPSPALAQFQGPALLVFNDGVFTDTDFRYTVASLLSCLALILGLGHRSPCFDGSACIYAESGAISRMSLVFVLLSRFLPRDSCCTQCRCLCFALCLFRSIQRIGDSLKKDTSKGGKTGVFLMCCVPQVAHAISNRSTPGIQCSSRTRRACNR